MAATEAAYKAAQSPPPAAVATKTDGVVPTDSRRGRGGDRPGQPDAGGTRRRWPRRQHRRRGRHHRTARRMSRSSLVPEPLARLPWRVILLVIAIGSFGLVVLYSAAGGSLTPWALSQGIRFFVFVAAAIAAVLCPRTHLATGGVARLCGDRRAAGARRAARRGRGRQPALARPRLHPPPTRPN